MADSDDSYNFSKLDAFVRELRAGADLVMGNRFLGCIEPGAMPWKNRYIGNPFSGMVGFFFAPPLGIFIAAFGRSRATRFCVWICERQAWSSRQKW